MLTNVPIKKCILTMVLFTVVFYIILQSEHNWQFNITRTLPKSNVKTILYWTKFFGHDDFYMGFGNVFQKCNYSNCFMTNNKTLMAVEDFDAIMFHGPEFTFQEHGVPSKRSSEQVYIFVDRETPVFHKVTYEFADFFNWTLTYRLDSDVIWSYGNFTKMKTEYKIPTVEEIRKKTKKIAWFVSNCNSISKRHILYEKINKYIPVDVYGSCGSLKCPRKNESACYKLLDKNYKFYLSFENSLCDDYVTEKLYKILKHDVVPIVYGHVDYNVFAPPNSVINVGDFRNISDLVDYIKGLDENPEEYLEYFKWKTDFLIEGNNRRMLCSLCEQLNKPRENKVYSNIFEWLYGHPESKCHKPPEILNT